MWALSALICTLMLCRLSGSYYTLCDKDTLMSCWLKKKPRAKIFESAQPILMYQRIYIVFEIVYIFCIYLCHLKKYIEPSESLHGQHFTFVISLLGRNILVQTKLKLHAYKQRFLFSFTFEVNTVSLWTHLTIIFDRLLR